MVEQKVDFPSFLASFHTPEYNKKIKPRRFASLPAARAHRSQPAMTAKRSRRPPDRRSSALITFPFAIEYTILQALHLRSG